MSGDPSYFSDIDGGDVDDSVEGFTVCKKLIKWNQMNLFQPEHLSKKHKDERMANAMPCHDYKVESCLILHI